MLDRIFEGIVAGDAPAVTEGVEKALETGFESGTILNRGMIAAMAEVGRRFEQNEIFVPEMLISARAMKMGLAVLQPHLAEADVEPVGKVVLGTVSGDLHDIGKNLVGMMLEGAGFEVLDLGKDVPPETFVDQVRNEQPLVVGISALLTTTMPSMRRVIEALEQAGLRDQVTIMVGGAPVTQEFADQIGADIYAPDAASAASRARALLEVAP